MVAKSCKSREIANVHVNLPSLTQMLCYRPTSVQVPSWMPFSLQSLLLISATRQDRNPCADSSNRHPEASQEVSPEMCVSAQSTGIAQLLCSLQSAQAKLREAAWM